MQQLIDSLGPEKASQKIAKINKSKVSPRGYSFETELWPRLEVLVHEASVVANENLYPAQECLDSLVKNGEEHAKRYASPDAGVVPDQVLKDHLQQISFSPEYINNVVISYLDADTLPSILANLPKEVIEEDRLRRETLDALIEDPSSQELQGMVHSLPNCGQQSDLLRMELESRMPGLPIGKLKGAIDLTLYEHQVLLAKTTEDLHKFMEYQVQSGNRLVSQNTLDNPNAPDIRTASIIDPTLLQGFDAVRFLEETPWSERVAWAQKTKPDQFTESGTFVGNIADYAEAAGRLGLANFRLALVEEE